MPFVCRSGLRACVPAALCLLCVAAALALSPAAVKAQVSADPDYWKQTTERRNTVYRFVYSQAPQTIPSGYDPAREAEEVLRQQQRTLPASNPKAPSLWQQVRGVTVKSALTTAPRALGTIGLATGTFQIGWKIGSGLNAKFLKIGIPEATDAPQNYRWNRLVWTRALQHEYSGARWPAADGWLIWLHQTCCWYYDMERWFQEPCRFSGFVPPEPFRVYGPVQSTAQCTAPTPSGYADIQVLYGWAPENALGAPGPIEDYTGQPYTHSTPAPTPPPQTTVEQSIETELDQPENALLRQWLNHKLGSPTEHDPLGIEAPNPDVEFPGFVEHWEEHGDEFTAPYEDPVEYWRDAADIVKRGDSGQLVIPPCVRSDGAVIYWDDEKRAIVIVKDGKIVTFFPPLPRETAFDYFLSQCNS